MSEPYYAEEREYESGGRLSTLQHTPQHYEHHQVRQSEKIRRQYENEKLARKMGKSMERIGHSGDARWGDAPLKALQQLKQMDDMLLGEPRRKPLTPEERDAVRQARQERLGQLSQPRVVFATRTDVEETRKKMVERCAAPNNKAELAELLLNNPLGIRIPGAPRRRPAAKKGRKGKRKAKGKKAKRGSEVAEAAEPAEAEAAEGQAAEPEAAEAPEGPEGEPAASA